MKKYAYSSMFAQNIEGLIKEKKALGYKYEAEAAALKRFDDFCIKFQGDTNKLSKELVYAWNECQPHETQGNMNGRISIVRQLGKYMANLGYDAYVFPTRMHPKGAKYIPYIYSDEELIKFFKQVDACFYLSFAPTRHLVMPVLFRMLYGCGLRVSEALMLKVKDVNLETGVLSIYKAKFDNDRLVPMHKELTKRCKAYFKEVHAFSDNERYFFPSANGNPFTITNIYRNFRRFLWKARISHGGRGKGPRVHDFRHTFAVHCLRRWVLEGKDLMAYLPVLKAYLGHNSFSDTSRYLRLTADLFPNITAKMTTEYGRLIPEIKGDKYDPY